MTPAADPVNPLVERQLQVLGELAELGLEIARAVARRVEDAAVDADLTAAAMAYARVARAVRLSVMLQSKLLGDVRFRQACATRDAVHAREDAREERKERVERIVGRIIDRACGEDEDAADRLMDEAGERLDNDDLYGDLTRRPVGELVARICQDLGLDPDWSALAEEAWAQDEIAGGAPGSPFAGPPGAGLTLAWSGGMTPRPGPEGGGAARAPPSS